MNPLFHRNHPRGRRRDESRFAPGNESRLTSAPTKVKALARVVQAWCGFWLLLALILPAAAQTLSDPVFVPPSGSPSPNVVIITNVNTEAVTYFTLDGTLPDTNSTRYTGPLTFTRYTVLRARAFVAGQPPSAARSAYYLPTNRQPDFSYRREVATNVPGAPLIMVSVATDPQAASYTVEERLPAPLAATSVSGDGVWNPDTGTVRWGPFTPATVRATNVLTYRVIGLPGVYPLTGAASVDGQWKFEPGATEVSIVASVSDPGAAPAAPAQVAMPQISAPGGPGVPAEVSLACPTPGAVIRFTLNGSVPGPLSPIYSEPLHLEAAGVVRARGFAEGLTPSGASVAFFGAVLPPPDLQVTRTVDPGASGGPLVSLNASPGATAHCYVVEEALPGGISAVNITAGGIFSPAESVIRWGPFFAPEARILTYQAVGLPGTYPVRATWSVDGVDGTETNEASFVIALPVKEILVTGPPVPVPPPVLSLLTGGIPASVTISSGDPQAEIRFTLDGLVPTSASPLYTNALELTTPTTLRARAFGIGGASSSEVVGYYGSIRPPPDLRVARSVNGESPDGPVVTLSVVPGPSASFAVCFTVEESLPVGLSATRISGGGVFSATEAVIRWGPFFGAAPVDLSYQAIGLPGTYPVRAVWSVNGVSDGDPAETPIAIIPAANPLGPVAMAPMSTAAPVLLPANGIALPVTVALSSGDPRDEIRYTLNGSPPTEESPRYSGALTLTSPTTVRARAFRTGQLPSPAVVGYYVQADTNTLTLVRRVTNNATYLPQISITAIPGSLKCYAVTETLAAGLVPLEIGQDGVWDEASRTLKWGPYTDAHTHVLTYQVTGAVDRYPLAGEGSFDGYAATITGATEVAVDKTTVVFNGNGNDGFGGAIGNGRLVLSNDGTNVYGTLITSGPMDNALVLYLATGPGGYSSTAGFGDDADGLRSAIAGYTARGKNGGPGRSLLTFLPDFAPGYAIALQPGNGINSGGLWRLANGEGNSLQWVTSVNLTPVGTEIAGIYRFSFNISNIGLTPGAGESFELLGTFVDNRGFRSNEAIAGDLNGAPGWNPFTQMAYATYTMFPAVFPLVVVQPGDAALEVGQTAQLAASAIGTGPLAYRWQRNGENLTDDARISGSHGSTLTIANLQPTDAGTYLLTVGNSFGSTRSEAAVLKVANPVPRISLARFTAEGFSVQVATVPGAAYRFEASTDLVNWVELSTTTAASDPIVFVDPQTASFGERFYRVIRP